MGYKTNKFTRVNFYVPNELLNDIEKFKENYGISKSATYSMLLRYGLLYDSKYHIVSFKNETLPSSNIIEYL